MAYPQQPDFTSAGADEFNPPAWWNYTRDGGSVNACATTGAAVVRRVRAALGLSNTSVWDTDLQAALLSRAQVLANAQPGVPWQPLLVDLQSGLSRQQVTLNALKFAIWVAYYQPNNLRLDAISVDSSASLPSWGASLPDSASGDTLVCWDPTRDGLPGQLSQSDMSAAEAQSAYGIRIHPGESLPSGPPVVPAGPAGLSTVAIVGISAAVIALVIGVVVSNRSYEQSVRGTASSSPRRIRRNRR